MVLNVNELANRHTNYLISQSNNSQYNYITQELQMEDLCSSCIWEQLKDKDFSDRAAELYITLYNLKASRTVLTYMRKWFNWCAAGNYDSISCLLQTIVEFLDHLYSQKMQFNTIVSYRSAISEIYIHVDGKSIGTYLIIVKVIKGLFNLNLPKQSSVEVVDILPTIRVLGIVKKIWHATWYTKF
ncbi:12032_t:CDS:1 [Cetraspora pellucida]|uniref:12032_t:CDS:1 n=1 Tax=Cetraspora pellucida TaxID=1433469 RepID=A0A9N9NIK9_9GLOM|nr:12032_t:CDS:1 [Cetraspora pellucida]